MPRSLHHFLVPDSKVRYNKTMPACQAFLLDYLGLFNLFGYSCSGNHAILNDIEFSDGSVCVVLRAQHENRTGTEQESRS